MTSTEIIRQRLYNQHISRAVFKGPADAVRWLGAVQAQDYPAAKWAVGLRMEDGTDEQLEQAFTAGAILRTHVLRPTWHFVLPEDIRWMLALTGPRLQGANASRYRQLALDARTLGRSVEILWKTLEGGKHLTRPELTSALEQAGIAAGNERGAHIMFHAELEGIVCSGPRRDKHFTYALLEERVKKPAAGNPPREEAVGMLVSRFFRSRGPATVADFVWWSGLTAADARAGLEGAKAQLVSETFEGRTYWFAPDTQVSATSKGFHLLPNYDEYLVGYKDRSAIFDAAHKDKLDSRANFLFNHTIMAEGLIVGTWKRSFQKNKVRVETEPFVSLNKKDQSALQEAVMRYGAFLGMDVFM